MAVAHAAGLSSSWHGHWPREDQGYTICMWQELPEQGWTRWNVFLGFKIGTANIQKINKSICIRVTFLVQFYLNYLESNVFTVVELPLPS